MRGNPLRCPRRRDDLETRIVDDEVIVLDVRRNRVHRLNRSASQIWHHCDGQHSVSDLAARLAAAYELSPASALNDTESALAEFDRLELLADS